MTTAIKEELINTIETLPLEIQLKILDFVKALIPKGIDGKTLLSFKNSISDDDLKLISQFIEEECERINLVEW
ncbi:hypothetical protein [Thermodesulfovibrio sp. TK110]